MRCRATPRSSFTRSRGRTGAPVLLGLAIGLFPLLAPGGPDSPLVQLARELDGAPPALRADLARSALLELSAAYASEAQRARADRRGAVRGGDLRRWLGAIDALAVEHAALAADLDPATPVDLIVGPDRTVQLIVAGRPVVVSAPRLRDQAALEHRVVARYCELNLCDPALFAAGASETPPVTPPGAGATHWSFSAAGPICSSGDGLEFQFENTDDLVRKRAACALVVAELDALRDALTRQSAADIDWNALRIGPRGSGELERVVLNRDGSDLYLHAPNLAALPELFLLLRPWLAARVQGQDYHLVVLNAGRQFAPLAATLRP